MKVKFDAIFMPPYTKSRLSSHSYFIVTPQTYKSIIGFDPITNAEYFHLEDFTFSTKYFNSNSIDGDKVNMYAYELIFCTKIPSNEQQSIAAMIARLEQENKIKHINIEIEVNDNLFF